MEKYTSNGIRPGLRTIQRYKVLGRKLIDFQKAKKIEISFDCINVQFSNDFVNFLINKKLTNNTFQLIPLSGMALQIIKKYDGNPQFISAQKQNKHIKEICKLAGIDNQVTDYKEIGNKLIEELKPKYELISTHTARRTFITKLKMMGLPDDLIKISTGHRTSTELNKYFRSSLDSAKQIYKDLWKL